MLPVVTPTEMRAIDEAAPESVETLIERAGWAVANEVRSMLGGAYGRRVWILAGPGNNGADGREAGRVLTRWGVRCRIIDARRGTAPPLGADAPDLVVDAAFGTGLSRPFHPPTLADTPVLAVDIPSGVNGLTGETMGTPLRADRTITLGAFKPGLLFGDGPALSGQVVVASLGLDCSATEVHLLGPEDLARWPVRARDSHKWKSAVRIVGGDDGMGGATALATLGAFAAGASYVEALGGSDAVPVEAVRSTRPVDWGRAVAESSDRFGAIVIGPGMDPAANQSLQIRGALEVDRPLVLDGGALAHIAELTIRVSDRRAPTVLTPHDGEYQRLLGRPPGVDRIAAARRAADAFGCTVVLKGPTTVVAEPDGPVLLTNAGDQRLATAGTGDVLTGVIAAGLAQGLEPIDAAALGALAHGTAGTRGPWNLTASQLPELLGPVLSRR